MVPSFVQRSRVTRVALAASAMTLAGARLAAAQPEPMALTWHAPRGCPTEARIVADVSQNLTGSGVAAEPSAFAAVVGVRRTAGARWEASLLFQSRDMRAERRFEAESCEAIASAAALVIALWAEGGIDAPVPIAAALPAEPPLPAVAPAPFEPSRAPEVRGSPTITASPPSAPAAPLFDPERARYVLMMNWLVDRNTMPEAPALGIEVAGGRMWKAARHWRVRALGAVSYFPSQHTSFNYAVSPGDVQLLDVSSRGCLTFAAGRLEMGPCAGAELAVMHGSVDGGDLQDPTQLWLSLLGGAAISWRVYPAVAIFGRGEVVAPTTQRTFIARETVAPRDTQAVGQGYTVPAVAGRGAVGIEMRFQ
jgi:hypothetical protein